MIEIDFAAYLDTKTMRAYIDSLVVRLQQAEEQLAKYDWHPVADGLPPTSCRVLVRWAKGNGLGYYAIDAASFLVVDQFNRPNVFIINGGFSTADKFTHWMHLPTYPHLL